MPGLRYLGRGEFIPGVPARDLTAEEAAQFRAVLDEHRRNTGRELYGPLVVVLERGDPEMRGDAEVATTQRAGRRAAATDSGDATAADAPTGVGDE